MKKVKYFTDLKIIGVVIDDLFPKPPFLSRVDPARHDKKFLSEGIKVIMTLDDLDLLFTLVFQLAYN